MDLKEYIIQKSKELNIDTIGFTDCEPLSDIKVFSKREKENKQTEFEEKDIEKRINPKLAFPDCKSIIVIGLSYNNTFNERVDYRLKGFFQNLLGFDYHIVLKDRMKNL